MNINEFKLKPKVIEIVLDDADLVNSYGDKITFYMYDHMDLTSYFKFFKAQSEGNMEELLDVVKNVILDDKHKPVITEGFQLPIDIFTAAVLKITNHLGKSVTKNSTQKETGTQQ